MLDFFIPKTYDTDAIDVELEDIDSVTNFVSAAQKAAKYKRQNCKQVAIDT